MATATLKSLTFTAMPAIGANPTLDRRNRIIAKLEEQKALLKDQNFTRTIKVRETKGGPLVEKTQKVQQWWRPAANGTYAFGIRVGRQVEFAKDQTAVVVQSLDKLPAVIDTLIVAVRNGELDGQLEAAGKLVGAKKKKAA